MIVTRSGSVTNTGRKRRHNEDSYVHEPPLFALADGMGGARAGEVASGLAASALREGQADGTPEERVAALIQEANRRIYQRSSEDAEVSGMGTTMTVALVESDAVTFGHVGDSRAYVLRDDKLDQLTDDHSLVAELVRGGKLSPEEADHHPQRSVITRAVGSDPDVDVDTFTVTPRAGDLYILCSDGLTDMLDDTTIERVLAERRADLDGALDELVRRANKAGGEDNITVVAFELGEELDRTVEQTRQMPPVREPEPEPGEEDTLDESDAVPAVDTMVVAPGDPEHARLTAAQSPAAKRRRGARVWPVLLLLLVAAAIVAFWIYAR